MALHEQRNNTAENSIKILGVTIRGFAQALSSLHIIAGSTVESFFKDIDVMDWHPIEKFTELEKIVLQNYINAGPILERVGMAMMNDWYYHGPGKEIINSGAGFLHFQSSSEGYHSLVKGPRNIIGSFSLAEIDETEGSALIHSTTPFDKNLERGIIIGGMSAPGNLLYIDVDNSNDANYFKIEFH